MADLLQCAYFAGLLDGEGYVGIRHVKRSGGKGWSSHALQIVITNQVRAPLELGKSLWGGNISSSAGPRGNVVCKWNLSSQQAADFLRCVLPFLMIKREQGLLAIQLQGRIDSMGGHGRRITPEELAIRTNLQMLTRSFNQRKYYPRIAEPSA